MMRAANLWIPVFILLVYLRPFCYGHGFLRVPKSRNWIAHEAGQEYCQHCLNAGGPGAVGSRLSGGWPASETEATSVRHGLCGDATRGDGNGLYNPFTPPTVSSQYNAGAEIEIQITITAHHKGHYEFRLCDTAQLSNGARVTQTCLNSHVLQRVPINGEKSPVDPSHPERYYLEPSDCNNYQETQTMKYKLPEGVTCQRCVLQWWYVTANSCNPPAYATRTNWPNDGCSWWNPQLQPCGTGAYPEEFWNCADIRIVPAGAATSDSSSSASSSVSSSASSAASSAATSSVASSASSSTSGVQSASSASSAASSGSTSSASSGSSGSSSGSQCAALWDKCGGIGWQGPTCCSSGVCELFNEWYSQCRNDGCPAGWQCIPKGPAPVAPPPDTIPPPVCQSLWGKCGGNGWTGPTCCTGNAICNFQSEWYSQCIPKP